MCKIGLSEVIWRGHCVRFDNHKPLLNASRTLLRLFRVFRATTERGDDIAQLCGLQSEKQLCFFIFFFFFILSLSYIEALRHDNYFFFSIYRWWILNCCFFFFCLHRASTFFFFWSTTKQALEVLPLFLSNLSTPSGASLN